MASKNEFFERYKDPRWQRRRLEVMEAAGFACEECRSSDKTLNVHHGFYGKNYDGTQRMPWDYPDGTLHCLCEECHAAIEKKLAYLRFMIGYLRHGQLEELAGYILGLLVTHRLIDPPRRDLGECVPIASLAELHGFTRAVGLPDGFLDESWEYTLRVDRRAFGPHIEAGPVYLEDIATYKAPVPGLLTVF